MMENEFEKKAMPQQIASVTTNTDVSMNGNTATATSVNYINVNNITGPLVVFFGPRGIGKTVALLRLCSYLDKYEITVDEAFRSDSAVYQTTIDAFNELRNDLSFAPARTGSVNFLLLNVRHNGNKICQILEAPGEHFFSKENPDEKFPPYLNKIFSENYKKVYVFFFSINMYKDDNDRRKYAKKIAQFLDDRVDPKRDKIIIVCTKCNENPRFMRGGKPIKGNYQKELYSKPGFETIKETITNNGFSSAPFVPFTSGDFNEGEGNQQIFVMSPNFYPEELWREIHKSLTGDTRSIFQRFLSK